MRDSLIFYRSFYEAIKELPKETQAEVYTAIFEYSLNFEELELNGLAKTIFTLIRPQLEANNKRFVNGSKAKTKQNKSEKEAKPKQSESKPEANNNNNNNVNNNKKVNKNNNKKLIFIPPTIDEVKEYFKEKGFSLHTAETAFYYYQNLDWSDSKGNKIVNWKNKMISVWMKEEAKIKPQSNQIIFPR